MTDQHATDSRHHSARRGDRARARGGAPIARTELVACSTPTAASSPPTCAPSGRAAVRSRGDGRLRGRRRRTRSAPARTEPTRAATVSIEGLHGPDADARGRRRRVHRDRDRRADAGRRRRRRAWSRRPNASDDDVRVLTPVYPRQNVGRRGADIAAGQRRVAAGRGAEPRRIGALAAAGCATWTSTRGRAWRSCQPATKSSSRASRSRPARSTTSTDSRSRRSSRRTAA